MIANVPQAANLQQAWLAFVGRPCPETFSPVYEGTKAIAWTLCATILRDKNEAEDAFQSAYCRLLVISRDPSLRAIADPEHAVARLVRREADRLRKRRGRRRAREVPIDEGTMRADEVRILDAIERKEICERVRSIVQALPDRYRLPVQLHYFRGLPLRDVARLLGCPVTTVSKRMRKVLRKLDPAFRRAGLGEAGATLAGIAAGAALLQPRLSAAAVFSAAEASLASPRGAGPVAGSILSIPWLFLGGISTKTIAIAIGIATATLLGFTLVLREPREADPPRVPLSAETAPPAPASTGNEAPADGALVPADAAGPGEAGKGGIAAGSGPGVRIPQVPTQRIAIDGDVEDFLLEDLDGDGFPDLVVPVNRGGHPGKSLIFLSEKDRFRNPSWTSADEGASAAAAIGDIDGDKVPDLVIVRYNHDPAVAYCGLGEGRFEEEPFWTSEDTEWASGIHIGDFDADGFPDILAKSVYDKHRIYRGGKDGPLTEADWNVETGAWASRSVLVDMDRDGRKDLVFACWQGPAYTVHRGLPKDFEEKPSFSAAHLGEHCSLAVGDLDGDGWPEIAVGSRSCRLGDGRVRVFGNRKGKPTREPIWMSDDLDADASAIVLADLDRDGDLDLLVMSGDHTAAYENRGGKLEPHPFWRASIEGGAARVGDVNRDGWPDLVVAGRNAIDVYRGGNDVPLVKAEPFPLMPEAPAPPPLEVVRFEKLAPLLKASTEEKGSTEQEEILRREGIVEGKAPFALDLLGIRLVRLTPELKERYGAPRDEGCLVVGVPVDVAWKVRIGNLRPGDVIVGVGSNQDYGEKVKLAADPIDLIRLTLRFGRESLGLVGIQWVCGRLHPSTIGEVRSEEFQMPPGDWSEISPEFLAHIKELLFPEREALKGKAIAVDAEGKEHAEEDGSLTLILWSGNSGENVTVPVEKGMWKAEVPADVKIEVENVVLGSRPAHVKGEKVPVPENRVLEVRAVWPKGTVLRVIAEDTRADLDGIDLVSGIDGEYYEREGNVHPGIVRNKQVVQSGARSPISLSLEEDGSFQQWQRIYWARAPGYAWGRIKVDLRSGGERQLVLPRAAAAEVSLENFRPGTKAVLRARPARALEEAKDRETPQERQVRLQPVLEIDLTGDDPLAIESMVPGRYAFSVEIGRSFRDPESLGSAEAELRAGETAQVAIVLDEPVPRGSPVPLAGTLFLPAAWGDEKVTLCIEPLDRPDSEFEDIVRIERARMDEVEGKQGLYRWGAGNLLPGKYMVIVWEWDLRKVVRVGPGDEGDVRIEVPEPAEVSLRLVDAGTGQDATMDEVCWYRPFDEETPGGSPKLVEKDRASGRFEFRAPAGDILFFIPSDEYRQTGQQGPLNLVPGRNERTLTVERACGIVVVLKDGEAQVPWDRSWIVNVKAKAVSGPGKDEGFGGGPGGLRLIVSGPGLYELTFGPIPGFEKVPPRKVDVKAGKFIDLVVALERAR